MHRTKGTQRTRRKCLAKGFGACTHAVPRLKRRVGGCQLVVVARVQHPWPTLKANQKFGIVPATWRRGQKTGDCLLILVDCCTCSVSNPCRPGAGQLARDGQETLHVRRPTDATVGAESRRRGGDAVMAGRRMRSLSKMTHLIAASLISL